MNVKRSSRAVWLWVAALVATLLPLALPASPAMAAPSWSQVGQDIDGEAAGDNSGYSVAWAADGGTVAIGAINNKGPNGTLFQGGHVRVYDLIGATWVQRGADIDGTAGSDSLGFSVALSDDGNTVAIGAPQSGSRLKGYVRVYDWISSSWVKRGADINGSVNEDQFGRSVAMSADGNTVAIGAPQEAVGTLTSGTPRGYVRVYDWNGTTWVQRGADMAGEDAYSASGFAVDLSADGTIVAIGAILNPNYGEVGQVRVYAWNGTAWVQRGTDIDGAATPEQSGWSVALSADGNTVAIGAPNSNLSGLKFGKVRIYDWNTSAWVKRGADIVGETAGDYSGRAVALSANGNTVAIGAQSNSGGGTSAGHVRVYDWDGTATPAAWVQRGADIDGEAPGDRSGFSVALSKLGDTVIIGATCNDGTTGINTDCRGHVRVYRWQAAAAAPTVASIFPSSGTTAGGTAVTITGTGFSAGATVTIGGQACTTVVVVSDTQITCVTPSGTAGTANVVVTNSDSQTGTLSNGYTYVAPPSCDLSGSRTLSQGGWSNVSTISPLGSSWFALKFASGLKIGGATNSVTLNSVVAVRQFLPQSGTPAALTGGHRSNLTNKQLKNTLAGQATALTLNLALSPALAGAGLATGYSGTVDDLLDEVNAALNGTGSPSKSTLSRLSQLAEYVNLSFPDGNDRGRLICSVDT